jgi:hypothetical protein
MKFPPGIGCQSAALMVFVGFNPRVSKTNRALHRELMNDRNAFIRLESNRTGNMPYIAANGKERHYRTHARIAQEALRGTDYEGQAFEEVALATELFLCATEKTTTPLRQALADGSAECPKRHCWPVLHRARSKVVVALGDDVFEYLRQSAILKNGVYRLNTANAPALIVIPHPSRHPFSDAEIAAIATSCRLTFQGTDPQPWDFRTTSDYVSTTNETQRTRSCHWSGIKGWHVSHRVADLEWLQADPARRITYHLYRDRQLRFAMTLNASQLRTAIGSYVDGKNWLRTGYNNPVTRLINGARTEVFLPQWARYVSVAEKHTDRDTHAS